MLKLFKVRSQTSGKWKYFDNKMKAKGYRDTKGSSPVHLGPDHIGYHGHFKPNTRTKSKRNS